MPEAANGPGVLDPAPQRGRGLFSYFPSFPLGWLRPEGAEAGSGAFAILGSHAGEKLRAPAYDAGLSPRLIHHNEYYILTDLRKPILI